MILVSVTPFAVAPLASPRPQGALGPDDLAVVAGALPAPAVAEGGDHGQAAPGLGVGVGLAGFQVARAVVPRLDDEGLFAGQQAQGDRRPVREGQGGVGGVGH